VAERIIELEHGQVVYDGDVPGYQETVSRKLLAPAEA
jgi:hypothetical protein